MNMLPLLNVVWHYFNFPCLAHDTINKQEGNTFLKLFLLLNEFFVCELVKN